MKLGWLTPLAIATTIWLAWCSEHGPEKRIEQSTRAMIEEIMTSVDRSDGISAIEINHDTIEFHLWNLIHFYTHFYPPSKISLDNGYAIQKKWGGWFLRFFHTSGAIYDLKSTWLNSDVIHITQWGRQLSWWEEKNTVLSYFLSETCHTEALETWTPGYEWSMWKINILPSNP